MLTEQKKAMRSLYDLVAREYVRRDQGARQFFHNSMELGWLCEVPLQGKKLLDVGAGVGRVARYVGNQVGAIVEADLSGEMLLVARERVAEHSHASFVQCDAEFLPFSGASFDAVTCLGLFEYIADIRPFLSEFRRVTVPGGFLLFTCHNLDAFPRFRNPCYPTADHTGETVENEVRGSGYDLVRRTTVYHANGRWIWAMSRILQPIRLDITAIRFAVVLNQVLQKSRLLRDRGKVHLIWARRS